MRPGSLQVGRGVRPMCGMTSERFRSTVPCRPRWRGIDLDTNGSLNEYYHPDTGAALSHKGFIDWNLLVMEMICERHTAADRDLMTGLWPELPVQ